MSKENQPNLIVDKGLAITALGQFIQCLLAEPLKGMGQNIDKVIKEHIEKIKVNEDSADLTKVDFKTLAKKIQKEVVEVFENMDLEFKKPKINETKY